MTTTAQQQSQRINVDSLTNGKRLHAPVYDDAGVLLLAKGSTITPDIKVKLQARNISSVILSGADAAAMRLGDVSNEIVAPQSSFDSAHTERLVSVIEAVIDAEKAACEHYKKVIKATDGDDFVTQDLCIRLLADEEEHLVLFQGNLKEYAGGST